MNLKFLHILLLFLPLLVFSDDKSLDVIKKDVPLNKEESLVVSVEYGNGLIYLEKAQYDNVFEGEFVYDHFRPNINYHRIASEGRLDIHFSGDLKSDNQESRSHHLSSLKRIYDNELRLNLSDKIPIDLRMELGMIKGNLDFSGLRIRNLNLEIGVSQSAIIFDQPNPQNLENCHIEGGVGSLLIEKLGNANIENFHFEGGVGSYELDFSGKFRQNTRAKIEMGLGKLKLYLPGYIGTRIKVEKSLFTSLDIDNCFKKNDYYYNEKWEKTPQFLDIDLEAGVGKIDVVWVDDD